MDYGNAAKFFQHEIAFVPIGRADLPVSQKAA
jgi:hypothetical protein